MARWWKRIALCVGCLGATTPAWGQFPTYVAGAPDGAGIAPMAATAPPADGAGAPPAAPAANGTVPPGVPGATMPGAGPFMAGPVAPYPLVPARGTETTSGHGPTNAFNDERLPQIAPTQCHFTVDYLRAWFTKAPLPILLTTGSFNDPIPGALGQANTRVLLDETPGNSFTRNGTRVSLAYDCDPFASYTFSASGFYFEQGNPTQVAQSDDDGIPVLTRPFFNVIARTEDSDPLALPGIMRGRFEVSQPHQLYGAQANFTCNIYTLGCLDSRIGLQVGGRYMQLEEAMDIRADSFDLPGLGIPGNNYYLRENFFTRNRFYGPQVGIEWEGRIGPLAVFLGGKCAAGPIFQSATISSITRIQEPNDVNTVGQNVALLVGPGNAGKTYHERITYVPEGEIKVAYAFNDHVSFTVGYFFMYFANVVRPGNQVNRAVNVQPVTAPFDPLLPNLPDLIQSNLAVQGLSLGLTFSF